MPSLRCPNCFYATSVKKDEVQGVICQTCEYDLFHYYYTGRDEATVPNFIAEENKRLKKEKGRADRAALKEQTSSPKSDEPKSPARRWFKVAGWLVLVIVALRVVGVNDYIDNYRAEKALAEQEKALAELMEQGGFVDVDVYYSAKFLKIPTKAQYDEYLKEQAEKAAAERAENEQKFAEARKKIIAEKKAAEERIIAEKKAAEERKRTVGSTRIKSGYRYNYYTDGSCKPRSNEICISKSDYKVFCSRSQSIGVMYDVANQMSVLSNGNFAQLIRNGVRPKSRISLQGDTCVITSEATGMLNGSSVSDTYRGKVTSFYVGTNYRITVDGAL